MFTAIVKDTLHLSAASFSTVATVIANGDVLCGIVLTSTKCNLQTSGHVGSRSAHSIKRKMFRFYDFPLPPPRPPRKGPRKHEVKSFSLSRYDSRSRFPTSAGKKRDFRPKQDYKDFVSRYLSDRLSTEKAIDLLRKSANAR